MTHVRSSQNKRTKATTSGVPCSGSTEKVHKNARLKQSLIKVLSTDNIHEGVDSERRQDSTSSNILMVKIFESTRYNMDLHEQ